MKQTRSPSQLDFRWVVVLVGLWGFSSSGFGPSPGLAQETKPILRIGIIGLDTSHATNFARVMNDTRDDSPLGACQVVCAYAKGSADIESSVSRVPKYTQQIQEMGIEIVDSIDELISKVDAVLLETNDGRPHLEQVLPVLKSGKPVFVDKPIAASLADAIAIFEAARHFDTPLFSSSSLRYAKAAQLARKGELVGEVLGCNTFSPASLEPTHPDLFWYGIHGVEQLFTVMGKGCKTVARSGTSGTDIVVGIWKDDRIGTFRGTRTGPHNYGGTVFGTKGQASTGGNEGYTPLLVEIAEFFQTKKTPISPAETIEIYAFMAAADLSKANNGAPIRLADVIDEARTNAASILARHGIDDDPKPPR